MDWVILFVDFVPGLGTNSTDQSSQWPQHEHPVCEKGEPDFPSYPTKPSPQKMLGRICGSPGVP